MITVLNLQPVCSARGLPLLVVCLAVAGCGGSPASPEERAVARFEELGARLVRNDQGRPCQLYLAGTAVTDEDFRDVVHLTELKHVEIGDTGLTDQSIHYLLKLSELKSVDLSFSAISANGVRQLQRQRPELRVSYADRNRYRNTLKPVHSTGRGAASK